MRVALLVTLAACGRLGFDPVGGAVGGDAPGADADAATTDDAALATGLLLHLTFDTDVTTDSSGRHHDATCVSCAAPTAGRVGSSAALFSASQCLRVPDDPELQPSTLTFATWVKPSATITETAYSHPFHGATTTNNSFEIYFSSGNVADAINSMGGLGYPLDTSWHHLAGSFDGVTITFFIDGVAQAGPFIPGPIQYFNGDDIRIGCDFDGGLEQFYFSGALDDLRLYDHALSPSEVAALAAM